MDMNCLLLSVEGKHKRVRGEGDGVCFQGRVEPAEAGGLERQHQQGGARRPPIGRGAEGPARRQGRRGSLRVRLGTRRALRTRQGRRRRRADCDQEGKPRAQLFLSLHTEMVGGRQPIGEINLVVRQEVAF